METGSEGGYVIKRIPRTSPPESVGEVQNFDQEIYRDLCRNLGAILPLQRAILKV